MYFIKRYIMDLYVLARGHMEASTAMFASNLGQGTHLVRKYFACRKTHAKHERTLLALLIDTLWNTEGTIFSGRNVSCFELLRSLAKFF